MPDSPVPDSVRAALVDAFGTPRMDHEGDARTITATLCPGDALAGPPGRLHGGLHAALRLLAPLEALAPGALEASVRLEVALQRAIRLGESVSLGGELRRSADGFELETRVGEGDRLRARATSAPRAPGDAMCAHFREALEADDDGAPRRVIHGRGNVRVEVGPRLVRLALDDAYFAIPELALAYYRAPGGALDPVFACVALDLVAAYAVGVALESRLYTTRFDLVVDGTAPAGEPCLLLGDRTLRVDGTPPDDAHTATVLLADAALTRAYAYGEVTLVRVRERPVTST